MCFEKLEILQIVKSDTTKLPCFTAVPFAFLNVRTLRCQTFLVLVRLQLVPFLCWKIPASECLTRQVKSSSYQIALRNSFPNLTNKNSWVTCANFSYLCIIGYTGNRFFAFPQFGHTSKVEVQSALCDFTNGYQFTKGSEFAPLPFYHASLDCDRPGNEIYPRSTGMIPSYKGHVPGMSHRFVRSSH